MSSQNLPIQQEEPSPEVIPSPKHSTDIIFESSDDPEPSEAVQQSSPPSELVNDRMPMIPSMYSHRQVGEEEPEIKLEVRFTAILCTGLEKIENTSFCNLLIDKNISSTLPAISGNSHTIFMRLMGQNKSSENTIWTEINSDEVLTSVIAKLSSYNQRELKVLDVLLLLDINVPRLPLCLLQCFLVTFVTYKMQGKKFDNNSDRFFQENKCYSNFIKELLSSACIRQKYGSENSGREKNKRIVSFVGICKESSSQLNDEANVVHESLSIIKEHINCPIGGFPVTIWRTANSQYLHLVSLQDQKEENIRLQNDGRESINLHFKEIISKFKSTVDKNFTQMVPVNWILFYFEVQRYCTRNNKCFVEFPVCAKIWNDDCNNSNRGKLKEALKFFHDLGAWFFLDSDYGMNSFIITNLCWLFDNLKYLCDSKDNPHLFDYDAKLSLKHEGILMNSMIKDIELDYSKKVKFEYFVNLLEHLKFAAPMDQRSSYFIPSVLDSYEGKLNAYYFITPEFKPLLITISSGSLHHSIFCFLAAYMFDNVPQNWSKLKYNEREKVQYTFKDLMTFSVNIDSYPCYVCIFDKFFFLEIHIYRKAQKSSQKDPPNNLCSTVFEIIKDSLKKAVCDENLKLSYKDFKYGFSCCMCQHHGHLMEVKKVENNFFATCTTSGNNMEINNERYVIWFREPLSVQEVAGKEVAAEVNAASKEETFIDSGISEKQPTLRQLLVYKNQIVYECHHLGKILLGEEIQIIKKEDPNKQCSLMLRAWVEGKNHHTWGIFIDALKEVGRMDVAKDILQKLQEGDMNTQERYSEPVDNEFTSSYHRGHRSTTKEKSSKSKMVVGSNYPRYRLASGASKKLSVPAVPAGYDPHHGGQPHSATVGLGYHTPNYDNNSSQHTHTYGPGEGLVLSRP